MNRKKIVPKKETASYNEIVEAAYFATLKKAKVLLGTIEQEEPRFTLERTNKHDLAQMVVHEFVSPLLFLRLEYYKGVDLVIHFGIEEVMSDELMTNITAVFLRSLFHNTSKLVTKVDIERCVRTDWIIFKCSEMYEYIELQNKHHSFKQLTHKPIKKVQAVL